MATKNQEKVGGIDYTPHDVLWRVITDRWQEVASCMSFHTAAGAIAYSNKFADLGGAIIVQPKSEEGKDND